MPLLRFRHPRPAWLLAGLTAPVLLAALIFTGLNADHLVAGRILFYAIAALAVVGYATIGALIARRVPGNVIGPLLCLAGFLLSVSMLTEQYALYGLATAPGSLPAVREVGAMTGGITDLAVIQLIVVVLVFPDGRLASRRWRPVL